MYVYRDGAMLSVHPVRRSVYSAFAWLLIHLPLSAGLLIGGHVSAIATATEDELETGQRWLWGGGLGVGMLGMYIIAQLYRDLDPSGALLLPKQLRILPRLLAAIIYVLLPLASEESLTETSLISIGAAISGFCVLWEMITGLERGAAPFESWSGRLEAYDTVVEIDSWKRRERAAEAAIVAAE